MGWDRACKDPLVFLKACLRAIAMSTSTKDCPASAFFFHMCTPHVLLQLVWLSLGPVATQAQTLAQLSRSSELLLIRG